MRIFSERIAVIRQVGRRLRARFPRLSRARVNKVVGEEYDELADRPIRMYIPNLVEHEARERLYAENEAAGSHPESERP